MLKQAILASATAGFIALGALGATTSAASAGGYADGYGSGGMQHGGPGFSLQFGFGDQHPQFHQKRFCQPVLKKVKWWDRWGNPHRQVVVVGQKCFSTGPRPHHQDGGQWDNGDGGWDNNDRPNNHGDWDNNDRGW
jgi:hypothetical protein